MKLLVSFYLNLNLIKLIFVEFFAESIDITNESSTTKPFEMFTIMLLNIFNHLRDILPSQIRKIFLEQWFLLETFEQRFECFFRYDKLYQMVMQQLIRERLLYQLIRERQSSMEKQFELKSKECDQLILQLSSTTSSSSASIIDNKKTMLRNKSQIITATTTANNNIPQTILSSNCPSNKLPSSLLSQSHQQPKSQLKSILLSQQQQQPKSPVPSITTSESCCSNNASAYNSSGGSSPVQSNSNSLLISSTMDQSQRQISSQDPKPTSLELAEAVANKIHQTRCTTNKAKAISSSSTSTSIVISNKSNVKDSEYINGYMVSGLF